MSAELEYMSSGVMEGLDDASAGFVDRGAIERVPLSATT